MGRLHARIVHAYALLSVSDKTGLVPFAKTLVEEFGFRLLSTGGTARHLAAAGLAVTEVAEHTGFPEILGGRVKTLHPRIHAGLLAKRDDPDHLAALRQHGMTPIDLVVVNLYPFEQTVASGWASDEEAIEQIDIGGPSMLRSAAKNHASVTVVTDPADYTRVLEALREKDRLPALRRELAAKVFARTAAYDSSIASWLRKPAGGDAPDLASLSGFPDTLSLRLSKAMSLRYGENPHQQAALYGSFFEHLEQIQGKELSYNNILDLSAAVYLIGEFQRPTVAILKHTNPCGVASADTLREAWEAAFATDRQAPFGGIIAVNQTLDEITAAAIADLFAEIVIAPRFSDEARALLGRKKALRLLVAREGLGAGELQEVRSVVGGLLVQDRDLGAIDPSRWQVVTRRRPTEEEWCSLLFGWRVVRHVKSNAIVYARGERTLGIGAGQMSRVDSSRLAVWKARESGLPLAGSAVCSDAFFPFPDGLLAAADAGATAAVQPGGSKRDAEVIAAADDRGMAMVFTGRRHFRH